MKNIAIIAIMTVLAVLMGCISQQQPLPKEYTFSDGLSELQAIETKYDLGKNTTSMDNFDLGRLEIISLESKFESYNETNDIAALKSLTEFRLSYLNVQKSAKTGLDMIGDVETNCSNNKTISDALVYINYAIDNATISSQKFQEFKSDYPEYLAKTNINSSFDVFILQISSNLNDSANQVRTQLQGCI